LVAIVAALLRKPFGNVPENTLKFVVGVMLVSFGTFWLGEGLGVPWPLGDATVLALMAACVAAALLASKLLTRQARRSA
jgi:uncharacterized membrane protein